MAAQNCIRAHRWKFGDMPIAQHITQTDGFFIAAYICALQREIDI
ncbi:hypothetical protein [Sulfitobacter sp. S223]|nr:hypothetical protein [Sulfitobacter sp. S223]